MPPIRRRIANLTPGPEYKNVSYQAHPTMKGDTPIPQALMADGGMHHPEVRALVKGERLPNLPNLSPLPIDAQGNKYIPEGKTLHPSRYISKVNQAAGYSDQPGLAWDAARTSRLSEDAKYASVPASSNFYSLDDSLQDLTERQQAGAARADFQDEVYLRNGANLHDSFTSLGERPRLITDEYNLNNQFRQEFGDSIPHDIDQWHNTPVRSVMPQSDSLDFAPQNRFVERRNTVPLPPQSISSPTEQAALQAGLAARTSQPLGTYSMNTRSVQVGDMPEPQLIEGAYLRVNGQYEPYTPSADLNQRNDELNNLVVGIGMSPTPYVAGASVDIAGHEYPRNPDLMPDVQDAIALKRQKVARVRGQANASEYSPTARLGRGYGTSNPEDLNADVEQMWRSGNGELDRLSAAENTLRSIQSYDPAHNILSQGFDVSVDVAPGQPTIIANNIFKRHGLSPDVGGSGNNNVLSASGTLPVEGQVELARSLRSTLNPNGGMMGLADSDPEMAGLREQWKQQQELARVRSMEQAKIDNAIAQVRADNGLGIYTKPRPRQTIEVLNQEDIETMAPLKPRRSRLMDDDFYGAEPSAQQLMSQNDNDWFPDSGRSQQQLNHLHQDDMVARATAVNSPNFVITSDTSLPPQSPQRPPRTAAEVFYQQNYVVPQERILIHSPQPRNFNSGSGAFPSDGFIPGSQQPQPNWIIPSAIAGGVLGAGALGYAAYNSQREDERKRQAQRSV